MKHKHKWAITRTIFPFEYGWGVYCEGCKTIIVTGLASKDDAEEYIKTLGGRYE